MFTNDLPGAFGLVELERVRDAVDAHALDQTPQGYKEMDSRQALKVLVRP